MKRIVLIFAAVLAVSLVMAGCEAAGLGGDDDGDSSASGTISGTLEFVNADGSAVESDLTYYVSAMTQEQLLEWQNADAGDPSSYETASAQGVTTSTASDNTAEYSVSDVPADDYYVVAFAWVTTSFDSGGEPDYAGLSHMQDGPGTVTDGGTLTVDLTVSPLPD
jgi:hypothetical protein